MRNYFTLDGTDSRTFGIYINGQGVFDSPARDIDFIQVPGRNGDLIGLSTRLENGTLTYADSFIYSNFRANLAAFRAFALMGPGYRRLIDTYNPDEYRLVTYAGPLTVTPTAHNNAGQFSLVFNCMPQRFLLSGELPAEYTSSGAIVNPTRFDAQPLLRVYGSGTLGIGGTNIVISAHAYSYMDIDCATGRAYYSATPLDSKVTLNAIDYPVLKPGSNGVSLSSGITRLIIQPRWWTV